MSNPINSLCEVEEYSNEQVKCIEQCDFCREYEKTNQIGVCSESLNEEI